MSLLNTHRNSIVLCVTLLAIADQGKEPMAQTDSSVVEHIIVCINKCEDENFKGQIAIADGDMRAFVDNVGYRRLIKEYHELFGNIVGSTQPTPLPHSIRCQIIAEKGRWTMIVSVNPDGAVSYLHFVDPDPIIELPKRNSRPMRLPFRGEWIVIQGGPTLKTNQHMESGDRFDRHAIDFSLREADGYAFKGNGSKLDDYTIFGKEILAVADGEVVSVVDGSPDNKPFTINPTTDFGNLVIIKHANNEFSWYCHLKYSSTRVKVGQRIISGQVLGECGNSGFSATPHLHFQITNSDIANLATGIPPYFRDVIVTRNGIKTTEKEYSPLRNDSLQSRD